MRIPRVYHPGEPLVPGASLDLSDEEGAHLARVLRVRVGDPAEAFDGEGGAARCQVAEVRRQRVRLEVLEPVTPRGELPFGLEVAAPAPKGKRVQRLVEGLSELGVAVWHPLTTARSEGKAPDAAQVERWAVEAAKQCHRDRLLRRGEDLDLSGLAALAGEVPLAWLGSPREAAPLATELGGPRPARLLVAVGPEGGWREEEEERLRAAGLRPVVLGVHVLRLETAALSLAAAAVAAWGRP